MIDLHAHFPMHLLPAEQQRAHERARAWFRQRAQARIVDLISHFANYQGPGDSPGVTPELMRDGGVEVALSVLYQPFDEMDLSQRYGAPPRERYFDDLLDQLKLVEDRAATGAVTIAHTPAELKTALAGNVPILIHAVEGGFQLGHDADEIRKNVKTLAAAGVAYVTVAHLFFRDVATNAPALPFLPDWVYHLIFPQRKDEGLTELGRAAVEAMAENGILVDITHMSARSISDTLTLLGARQVPVIATHMAYRFGGLEYSFDDDTVKAVAARGGLLGCILCEHYITSGISHSVKTLAESVAALCRHIDKIHELTGSFDHIAIGSDLDGYIKPALPGLEHMGRMGALRDALRARYGDDDAEKICRGNALRILNEAWGTPG
jgi:microsomal dipeptidase-like Zn-dependent dipeptidase